VWYKYTTGATPTSAIRQFSLFSDSVDSFQTLEVFTGSTLANLTRIARVEDYKATLVTLAASTTYYLRVSNDDSYSTPGAFEIEIAIQPSGTAAANNNFASATNLGSGLNVPTSSNTFKSTLETSEKNPFAVGGTVWFRWTAPSTGWFTVSAESDDWPPALAVWSGTALANLKLRGAANSYGPSVTFAATSGETLYFQAGAEGGYSYPFEPLAPFTISVSADTDPGLPRLTSLTLSAASVNVTSASQSVTATLSMAGPEDGFIDALYLLHPNGGVVDAAFYEDITQISGTPGNGDFTATLEVPRGLAPGSYSLVAYLTKDFGDYLSYGSTSLITPQSPTWAWESHFDIPSGTDQITVTNTGTADTAPNLTSFTVSPTSGDVGTAAQTFNLSAVITDAQGVFAADVEYRGPDGEAVGVSLARTSGTATSGTWTGSFTIPRYSAPGRVNLTLRFVDTVGQSKRFGIQPNSLPLDDKFAGRLLTMSNATITLTNTAGIDIIPPQASEVTVTPNPATFALGGTASVTVSTRVKDALSGTSSVEVSLDGFTFTTLPRTSGTAADGIYSTVLNVDRAEFLPGVYALWISAGDGLGNISIFTPPAPGLPNVTLNALPGGYDEWSLDKNLSAPDDDPLAEPQGDGINNALKFASNLDPNLSITGAQRILDPVEGTSGLPAIRQVGSGATARLRVTFLRRLSTPGLAQVVEFCSDPSATGTAGWTPATGPETLESINAQWQRVTVEDVEGTGQLRRFGRLRVEVTR
jgi:hypothetical protein